MSGGAGRRRRLVLHVDLNNTVVVADTVTGQAPRAALNTFLSTVTWGRAGAAGEWEWVSDCPSLRPPCPGALSYYSRHGRDPAFTEAGPGRRFRDLHALHLRLLEWPGRPHEALSVPGEPGKRYHLILPSFFRLLDALHRDGRAFAVVFRTFGSDLPRALQAIRSALDGQHPQFPALRDMALPVDLSPGQIRCSKREVVLTRGAERLTTREDRRKIYNYFSSFEGIGGFQDHFDWWARNQFSSQGGKPLWIDPHDPDIHHIFIDDNIRLDDGDTIVHPQGTSPAHWTQWKGSASRRKSGSLCPPCPLAAAPAPAAQRPACSSSSAVWPRVPVVLSRLCACVMCPEQDPGDQPWPSTKCLKMGTRCMSIHMFTQGDLAPGKPLSHDARHESSRGFGNFQLLQRCGNEAQGKLLLGGMAVASSVEGAAVAGLALASLLCPAPSVPRRIRAVCVAVSAVSS